VCANDSRDGRERPKTGFTFSAENETENETKSLKLVLNINSTHTPNKVPNLASCLLMILVI
jgi:hypothetical protein